jgi:hypothetical protein
VTAPACDSETSFTFAVMGETRPTLPGMPFPRIAGDIMRELALLRPAFVLCAGDAIWGFQDTREEMLNELDRFRELADTTGVPLYNAPGNHELQSSPLALEVLQEWGHDLYGSFDVGRYHFVALNTEEIEREGRVTAEQLAWLEHDLSENRAAEAIFVIMHRPLFSWFQGDFNPDDGRILERLFADFPVRAVFAAHDHYFYEEIHDGVRYMTVGGGGAPAYTQPQAGGFAHYVLVTVGEGQPEYDVVEPNRIEVDYEAGNDGRAPVTTVRLANTTDRDLVLRNLELRVPALGSPDLYRITTSSLDYAREPLELPARLRETRDTGDGSVTLSVELTLPTGTGCWLTVEASGSEHGVAYGDT